MIALNAASSARRKKGELCVEALISILELNYRMPLSSNTLTHFTKKKESLLGILEGHFKIFFCKEIVRFANKKSWSFYAPMVSFCDIPMSEIKDHIKKYGSYGIGMTKEWAKKNGLNPVLYIEAESTLSVSYKSAADHYLMSGADESDEVFSESEMALLDVLRYMKNYEGKLVRKGETIQNYRFSDEREWRYVPPYSRDNEMLVPKSVYEKNPDEFSEMYDSCQLGFEPNDIKYIIIKDDSEIREVLHHLRHANGQRHTFDDIERLATRILTSEQIHDDF